VASWWKTGLCVPEGVVLPAGVPPPVGVKMAGGYAEGVWQPGLLLWGAPVGSSSFFKAQLKARVAEVRREVSLVVDVAVPKSKQAAWGLLQFSVSAKMDHHLNFCYTQSRVRLRLSLTLPSSR